MGLVEIMSAVKDELGEGQDDKVLAEAAKTHFKIFHDLTNTINCRKAASKSYSYYEQVDVDQYKEPTSEDTTGATEQTTEIRSTANRFRTTTNRRRDLLVMASYPPEAKVEPDVPSAADKTKEANEEITSLRRKLEWDDVVRERNKDLILSGSTFVYLGFDANAGEVEEVPNEDEVEVPVDLDGEEKEKGAERVEVVEQITEIKLVAKGEYYFESLRLNEVSLDREACKFSQSRTVVIRRQKTREQLKVAFPKKREAIEKLKAKSFATEEILGYNGESANIDLEDPYDLYEVLVSPEPTSEYFPKGLHAFIVGELVLSKEEEVYWQRDGKYRPIQLYTTESKKGTCLGSSPLWQLFGLQVIENLCLEIMLATAIADVPGKFYQEGLFDNKLYPTNDPQDWIPCKGSPMGKVYVTERANVAPAVIQVYNRVLQTWEELTQTYDLKHRFPSKAERKVGELEMLNEREQQSSSNMIQRIWKLDTELWQALYRKKHPGDESQGVDFVITTSNLPQSNAVKRAKLAELADMGVFGAPGSPEYVRVMRNILEHNDDLPTDPIMKLHELAAKKIIRWIEINAVAEIGETPESVADKVWIDENWDLGQIGLELDQWSLENGEGLNDFQRKVWNRIRFNLKKLAVGKQFKEQALVEFAKANLGMISGQNPGAGPVDQSPTDIDESVEPGI